MTKRGSIVEAGACSSGGCPLRPIHERKDALNAASNMQRCASDLYTLCNTILATNRPITADMESTLLSNSSELMRVMIQIEFMLEVPPTIRLHEPMAERLARYSVGDEQVSEHNPYVHRPNSPKRVPKVEKTRYS